MTATTDFRVAALALPSDELPGIGPARQGGAELHAWGARDADGRLAGVVAARKRRSASLLRITACRAGPDVAPSLVETVLQEARSLGVAAIRAADDMAEAVRLFDLAPTGRGYAQRWLAEPVATDPQIGAFNQTTGFTCGPVSLAMALGPDVTRSQEIAIWREATTMIGLTGPGGCDPYGLALSAQRHGREVTLYIDTDEPVLLDRANTEEKRDLMRFVQSEFKAAALDTLDVRPRAFEMAELRDAVDGGDHVLLLIDQCHTHDHSAPHWILLHAVRGDMFLVNDPWIERDDGEIAADTDCLPIPFDALERMSSYGDPPYRSAIVLDRTAAAGRRG